MAVARLITLLEDEDERAYQCMVRLYRHTGKAYIVGITGSPGAGKSTLTDRLTHHIRKAGLTVGIIAVDPSSPFTGGAILGDRVRMSQHNLDSDVYIRSMATRGFLGGMSKATGDVVKVLDAFGKDVVIIETVGVGQDEVDIIGIADTTCLILVPGLGDAIQSMKAGIMEIADIFVINKADRAGADQLSAEVCYRVQQDATIKPTDWSPPVVKTVAVNDDGVDQLWETIGQHRDHLKDSGKLVHKRRQRTYRETLRMIHNELFRVVREQLQSSGQLDHIVQDIVDRKNDPYTVMRQVVNNWLSVSKK
jgi:LAO/AO transport system kinase